MCGIVGYVGDRDATPVLVEGLHRLEYRGYDSAGVAVLRKGKLVVTKAAGRVQELRDRLAESAPVASTIGIAHTRWATHGEPSDRNAHPHLDAAGRIAVVHNGIIENAEPLRARLTAEGVELASDTDTEVFAHLIAAELGTGSLEDAVRAAVRQVEGTYGLVVLDRTRPDELVVARNGSPIVLGIGDGEMYVASDVAALVHHTQRVVFLDDGELATVKANEYRTSTLEARRTSKQPTTVDVLADDYELGGFPDFMRKEMAEQPEAVERALRGRLDERFATAHLGGLGLDAMALRAVRRVKFLGCGSAYYAGQMGATLVEELARIPADAEPASEFRYRNPVVDPDTLYVAISQSGETLDTLAAVQELRRKGGRVIGAVNVVGSAVARECGSGVFLHAGPEVSVASTKAMTNMTVSFAMLALLLGRVRDLSASSGARIVNGLRALPEHIEQVLGTDDAVREVARHYSKATHMFFLGRVRGWPVAREGAQKLKEISYVHAEAYQSAELKHGPLALIDPDMPSVVVVPDDELLSKNLSTMEQIKARGGPVIAVTNADLPDGLADHVIRVPRGEPELDPIVFTIALQMLAYHLAVELGRDVDKPRNLAKSVTVE
ncbi:glucosamine--fructose-6-phosphate aminotransferase (isomerizing) [Actinokineospora alba]|uniref:Glutamine--fructose-6-phosphate aminotransferase [isomerizing] n=1 Tax=Actinokineospora alba TaxID=504798 RepID=A0A1H0WF87_9PSEU|nr:glutamine--fructose-6-phosphate transaminase (isomerizing) [Actinokineospora alba]TDP68931.1 glucosamine--fructose-6-phosphate aminotransferase (isomerizing) [Actinokineospora alba]SDI75468.1 glucosamine--fructose-6-phosphate aminotransferase (isomerizing) [Actinokineospora alba]SDP89145.1 glucosamine--fructose-6-phosphate aminotransferase (isomerizing) [Actinokineospora alba]